MANVLTALRLILVPVFFGLLIWSNPTADKVAFVVFAIAALTDLFDGYVARHFNQASEIGKLIDPIADRALIISAIIGLFLRDIMPLWALTLLLIRDGTMVTGYWLAKKLDRPLVAISQFGRVTNFYLMATIGMLLFYLGFFEWKVFVWAFYLGVVLYMASGLVYIVQEAIVLKEQAKETA